MKTTKTLLPIYLLLILCLSVSGRLAADTDPFTGLWVMPDGSALLEIYHQGDAIDANGSTDYGIRIVSIRDNYFTSADGDVIVGDPRRDLFNPDPDRQHKTLVGLIIGKNFRRVRGRLRDGELYDPASGNTYKARIEVTEDGMLKVRGFLGISLLGRTMYWHRAKPFLARIKTMFNC